MRKLSENPQRGHKKNIYIPEMQQHISVCNYHLILTCNFNWKPFYSIISRVIIWLYSNLKFEYYIIWKVKNYKNNWYVFFKKKGIFMFRWQFSQLHMDFTLNSISFPQQLVICSHYNVNLLRFLCNTLSINWLGFPLPQFCIITYRNHYCHFKLIETVSA